MPRKSFRPQFHFSAPTGYLNDPNGLIQSEGVYHLFYQYHPEPNPKEWWKKHWGHATSPDLINWRDEKIALSHGDRPGDRLGCWSGCAIANGEEIRIYYTGLDADMRQGLCLARGDANLRDLKPEFEPLPVEGIDVLPRGTFRDPYVWRDGAKWRALLAGALPTEAVPDGIVELESDDGLSWRAARQRVSVEPATSWVIECPNRFILDGREVILCSVQPLWTALYVVGGEADSYSSQDLRLLCSASRFYAPLVFRDAKNRCIMMGYGEEARPESSIEVDGWCNLHSLPMELSLRGNELHLRPVEELTQLRQASLGSVGEIALDEAPRLLDPIAGDQIEIECEIEFGSSAAVFLDVLADPSGREFTRIIVDGMNGGIQIDNSHSSLDPAMKNHGGNTRQGPLKTDWNHLPPSRRLTLRVFVDHSVVDVFTSEGAFATHRAYPTLAESMNVRLCAQDKTAKLIQAKGWSLRSSVDRPAFLPVS